MEPPPFLLTAPLSSSTPVPLLNFSSPLVTSGEGCGSATLSVQLSQASEQLVKVDYEIVRGSAHSEVVGSGQDYQLSPGTLTFAAGIVTQTIPIVIMNDELNEIDETLEIRLFNPQEAQIGQQSQTLLKILDNDRKSLVNIHEFGAKSNDPGDDTAAIQKAIDTVAQGGGGVIVFSPGTYNVTSVNLKDNITYYGYGAVIQRPPNQGNFVRTFSTDYTGVTDSKPLLIQGFSFDGKSSAQSDYQDYQLEQSHLLFLTGDNQQPGRLRAIVEDCQFSNGVADGISIYTNVVADIYNCTAKNVFRGGFVLTGGNTSVKVKNFTTQGDIDRTGIDIEVDGQGYGNTYRVDVELDTINILDGDFDIGVSDGSNIIGQRVQAESPFYLFNANSTMVFSDSTFKIGAADSYFNRIVLPGNLTFERCKFVLDGRPTDREANFTAIADVWWQYREDPTPINQLISYHDCVFSVASTPWLGSLKKYLVYSREDDPKNNNQISFENSIVQSGFDALWVSETKGTIVSNLPNPLKETFNSQIEGLP